MTFIILFYFYFYFYININIGCGNEIDTPNDGIPMPITYMKTNHLALV